MKPLKIGTCLKADETAAHRDCLFEADREIRLQNFMTHSAMTTELEDRIVAAEDALTGHLQRFGSHCARDIKQEDQHGSVDHSGY
ncbi:MAG: hypothetical protein AAGK37_16900 [Pseudomonadota bacterium]